MADATGSRARTAWLDAEEMDVWLQVVGLMTRLPAALDMQLQRDAGMSHFEYAALARLSEAPDHTLRMSTLAAFTNGSLSRLSHVVKRLETRGWVFREPCPEDGRYTNAVLTEEGYARLAAAAPGHVEIVRRLLIDELTTAQLRQLGAIGRRVLARIDAELAHR
jgi:DNA-binding MarR family transcriptional regulator